MSDQGRSANGNDRPVVHLDHLRKALSWVINDSIFTHLRKHGNSNWIPSVLVMQAVLWMWSEKSQLTVAFDDAYTWMKRLVGCVAVGSYQGLTGILIHYRDQLVPPLWRRLQRLMKSSGTKNWRIGKWVPLAFDGSRVSTPRSKENEKAFQATKYGKSGKSKARRKKRKNKPPARRVNPKTLTPQIWLTMIWHMGLRLPWCWRTGPSDSSERDHVREMVREEDFPENTLFCGDAGFTGYDFWEQIMEKNHHFLIRVGGNVRLLTKLGCYAREREGIVYVWTCQAMRQKQAPLVLRLIHLKNERGDIYLLTSVINERLLSDALASRLYCLRWGVELHFRSLKQTFGRGKLRSRTPDHALVELEWSLFGLWIVHLFAVKEQMKLGEPPGQTSFALALQVVRRILFLWCELPTKRMTMKKMLQEAVIDSYVRNGPKRGRYHPNPQKHPKASKPKIIPATEKHKHQLAKYERSLTTIH